MFLVRYFIYAGSALLALLFLLNWQTPAAPTTAADQAQEASLNKEILRIRSAQKWPQKIEFDTNIPTIVPPSALVAKALSPPPPFKTAEALDKSPLNAHAEVKPVAQKPRHKVATVRHRTYRPAPPQFGQYPVASAWSPWW